MSPYLTAATNVLTLIALGTVINLRRKARQVLAETQVILKRARATFAEALEYKGKALEIVAELEGVAQ